MPSNYTIVSEKPKCDVCGHPQAEYDGKTKIGLWAYMCEICFERFGVGLGIGKGQKLLLRRQNENPNAQD